MIEQVLAHVEIQIERRLLEYDTHLRECQQRRVAQVGAVNPDIPPSADIKPRDQRK